MKQFGASWRWRDGRLVLIWKWRKPKKYRAEAGRRALLKGEKP